MIATDQTGHFPIISITGIQYIMVLYNYNFNAILDQACRSHIEQEFVDTYNKVYKCLQRADVVLVIQ